MGKWLQYIGRNTLAIYMLHYFFLPRNLQFIGNFFMQHSNPTLELFITMGIAILVIIISLITNAMICTSPFLAHYLLGVKK
jgi:fucose 4-O-acetylase-like acetyltransferase